MAPVNVPTGFCPSDVAVVGTCWKRLPDKPLSSSSAKARASAVADERVGKITL